MRPVTRFVVSLPERLARAVAAALGGTIHETAELLLPRLVRKSRLYEATAKNLLRITVELVGSVERPQELLEGELEQSPKKLAVRKAGGNVVELGSILAFGFSPLWLLAATADVTHGTRVYLDALVGELKAAGVLAREVDVGSVDDLLGALEGASGTTARLIDIPPLEVEALRQSLADLRSDASGLPTPPELAAAYAGLRAEADREQRSLLEVSAGVGLAFFNSARKVGRQHLLDAYSEDLQPVRDEGFAAYARRVGAPYATAVARHFDPRRTSLTERALDRLNGPKLLESRAMDHHPNTFGAQSTLAVGGTRHEIFRIEALQAQFDVHRLPYTLRVLLENVLRHEDGVGVTATDVEAVAGWVAPDEPSREISFTPGRVLLQDFTGVPAVVDLAAMRTAMDDLGGDPAKINPQLPVELVIDHSVQVDEFATRLAIVRNAALEFERNRERYAFLRWGQGAFDNFKVVPPSTGIVHQVNLEFLARVVDERDGVAFPDTLVGTDSHTTMINGLGVLGWGVGGIEAEAAMLGEAISMLVPQVVGFRLSGSLPEGATATDLVLTVTEILRATGVVGKFVEYFGHGLAGLPLADRATIGNMSPEYGATCGFFPVDEETLRYLRLTGRSSERIELVEAYCKENALWHDPDEPATYSQIVELDLSTVEPSLAGPAAAAGSRAAARGEAGVPRDASDLRRRLRKRARRGRRGDFPGERPAGVRRAGQHTGVRGRRRLDRPEGRARRASGRQVTQDGETFSLDHGSVVIAAITSCTNTSNPAVMVGAGLLARKAVERGLTRKPWVKSSLAPGSKVVTEYYAKAGLTPYLEELGFHTVGYGCTTCIGNSGPLSEEISRGVAHGDLVVCAVLSGNRNFEARIHPEVKANYLASPPLVVAYALAGRMDIDLATEPLGVGTDGDDVFLADIWPSPEEVSDTVAAAIGEEMFRSTYADVFTGDETWRELPVPEGRLYDWEESSTYVRRPPYFDGMPLEPDAVEDIAGARCLVSISDSVTTDHISPAGSIKPDSPAGRYLVEHGVERRSFNSYGSRRGNHEVMVRGTFANVRLRNLLVPGSEGTWTVHLPSGDETTIFEAAERYRAEGVPLVVLAGKEYGSGSSRDWAAKGPNLLGVRAVIAESYERIHRSNLLMMGVLPLQFLPGETRESLGLSGRESFSVTGVDNGEAREVTVRADDVEFRATVRLDTPREREYLRHGGILPYVLRRLLAD